MTRRLISILFVFSLISIKLGAAYAATQISQFGITWTFNDAYTVGQFVNGDWYVVENDPGSGVTIININPASEVLENHPVYWGGTVTRTVNGSMINPDPASCNQGLDSHFAHNSVVSACWDVSLNVARPEGNDLSAGNPLIVSAGSSLYSVISRQPLLNRLVKRTNKPALTDAAVLTVLAFEPAFESFRPPYAGSDKTIRYNKSAIDANTYAMFSKLMPAAPTPILHKDTLTNPDDQDETVERMFERPWLDWRAGDIGEHYLCPLNNMENYGSFIAMQVGIGALMLNCNYSNEEKETLLIRMLQTGLDTYGVLENGGENVWQGMGGHNSGRLFLILLAGVVFDDPNMKAVGSQTLPNGGIYHFGEIDQTFYVELTSTEPNVYNNGYGGYDDAWWENNWNADYGHAEWGKRHWWTPGDDISVWETAYRTENATGWAGFILAARLMEDTASLKTLYHHQALFDYQDKFMDFQLNNGFRGNSAQRQKDAFTENMWDIYRPWHTYVYVDDNSPGDPGAGTSENPYRRIQDAINAVEDGDTIIVRDGIYTGNGNRDIDFNGLVITVQSENGPDNCIIDCEQVSRAFHFHSNEDANSVIDGLTIMNGFANVGGGVICNASSPTVRNCLFVNCEAVYGGGIFNTAGSEPILIDCTFSACLADIGAGMFNRANSNPMLINCTFEDNIAYKIGGGIANITSSPQLIDCTLSMNIAVMFGGGILNIANSSPIASNCIISGNTSINGGAILNVASSPVFDNCTLSRNYALQSCSGILNYNSSSPTISNCILWGNLSSTSGSKEFAQILTLSGTPNVTFSCIQDDNPNDGYIPFNGSNGSNIDDNPLFVNMTNRNYHLLPNSPCIDAGDPDSDYSYEPLPNGDRNNMGAYGNTAEATTSP